MLRHFAHGLFQTTPRRHFASSTQQQTVDQMSSRTSRAWQWLRRPRNALRVCLGAVFVSYWATRARRYRAYIALHDRSCLVWHWDAVAVSEQPPAATASLSDVFAASSDRPRFRLSLPHLIRIIDSAADDPRIRSIAIDFSQHLPSAASSLGLAQIQEIGNALLRFRDAKRAASAADSPPTPVLYAFSDSFSNQLHYMLASLCDEIVLLPTGAVNATGIASETPFFRKFLQRIGVAVDAELREEYKSVMSPFLFEKWPDAQRDNMMDMMHELHRQIFTVIQICRNIGKQADLTEMNKLLEEGPFDADEAKKLNLVTQVGYSKLLYSFFYRDHCSKDEKMLPTQMVDLKRYASAMAYEEQMTKITLSSPKIKRRVALIHVDGMIQRSSQPNGARAVAKSIQFAAQQDKYDAIVLRVDSRGGDPIACDIIWDAVETAKLHKPVIASFGNYSASGGYFVSCAAHQIFTKPGTITGSIGVAFAKPSIGDLLTKLDISIDRLQTTTNASFYSIFQPFSEKQREHIANAISKSYRNFVERVSQGRDMSEVDVDKVARGRVFTGTQALENGLVDRLGGVWDAIEFAAVVSLATDQPELNILPVPTNAQLPLTTTATTPKSNELKSSNGAELNVGTEDIMFGTSSKRFPWSLHDVRRLTSKQVDDVSDALDIEVHVVQLGANRLQWLRDVMTMDSESMWAKMFWKVVGDGIEEVNKKTGEIEWAMPDIELHFE